MDCCCECGRSVAFGSGNFVNRIPECNTVDERKAMGRPYPEGDWVCSQCDATFGAEEDGKEHCRNCQARVPNGKEAIRVDSAATDEPLVFCNRECYDQFYSLGLWAVRGQGARQLVIPVPRRYTIRR